MNGAKKKKGWVNDRFSFFTVSRYCLRLNIERSLSFH